MYIANVLTLIILSLCTIILCSNSSLNLPTIDVPPPAIAAASSELFCLNGGKLFDMLGSELACECAPGYSGYRCELKNIYLQDVYHIDTDYNVIYHRIDTDNYKANSYIHKRRRHNRRKINKRLKTKDGRMCNCKCPRLSKKKMIKNKYTFL